jgi:putative protease
MKHKIELLSPAGNLEKLKIAILYGADAVYIGGKKFSLRARASNFDLDDIKEACAFAKAHQAKVYVTMNIIPHDEDFTGLEEYLQYLENVGVSAIITSSVHIMETALKVAPSMEVHVSTQLSVSNSEACRYYENLGVKRVVLAREVSLEQIKMLKTKTDISLEVFIHGGMCASYSGRCMLSNHLVNRDANRGGCAHSCRWHYQLFEQDQIISEFDFGSKDLVGIKAITKLIDLGVDSLKIEGRMKSDYYIATVVRTYRQLIDDYYAHREIDYQYYYDELTKAENRSSSTGFLMGEVTPNEQLYAHDETPTKEYVGIVLSYDEATQIAYLEQRNYFAPGDELEFFGPHLPNTRIKIGAIKDLDGNLLDAARHPKQKLQVSLPFKVTKDDMVRLVRNAK